MPTLNMPPKVVIEIIDHADQRYPTVGDWYFADDGTMIVRVSRMEDVRYSYLVAIHEMVEALQCIQNGVSEEAVTAFDKDFEEKREHDEVDVNAEPGDDPEAPYCTEHQNATTVERVAAQALGVDWIKYGDAVEDLP